MSKLERRERLLEKLDRDWERISDFYKSQSELREKPKGRLRTKLGSQIGIDRLKVSIPRKNIVVDRAVDIDSISIKEGMYSFKTGIHHKNWYSQLDINLPKVLHRNNLLNVRTRNDLVRAIGMVEEDLRKQGIDLEILRGRPTYLEINRTFELPFDFTRYHTPTGILLDEDHKILKKRFYSTTIHSNPYSGFTTGRTNKTFKLYEKCYEQLCHIFKDDPDFLDLPKREIIEIGKKYTTLARAEFMVRKQPLQGILEEMFCGRKEITMDDLTGDLERSLDTIYFNLLSEAGLSTESYETAKEKRIKTLVRTVKQLMRMHPHNFISALFKHRQIHLWGIDQGKEIFKEIGGGSKVVYDRTRTFEREFKLIKDLKNRPPEHLKRMDELIDKINEKV